MRTNHIPSMIILALFVPLTALAQDEHHELPLMVREFPPISPVLPFDATFTRNPTSEDNQKSFDRFSWASFVALNWPGNPDGTPMTGGITANLTAPRVWESYIAAPQVFKPDGFAPDPWGTESRLAYDILPNNMPRQKLLFAAVKATTDAAVELSEIGQAAFGKLELPPIVDINKRYVFYEIHINKIEYDYLIANKLYNQDGQSAFLQSASRPTISFPLGTNGNTPTYGAIEVKAAWKILGLGDDPNKFYAITATMIDPVTKQPTPNVRFGLVGLHIVTRTTSAPQWIWSTFEHIENAPDVCEEKLASHYSFNDPAAPQPATGFGFKPPLNQRPVADPKPTQITRVRNNSNINSDWTRKLNSTMQGQLKDTVWANYRLVTTQWPMSGGPNGPSFIPVPRNLTNTTIETYFQSLDNGSYNCMSCHDAAQTSGIDYTRKNVSANFSYLLQAANPVATPAAKAQAKMKIEARRTGPR